MTYLLQTGAITFRSHNGQGQLLLTEKHIYALANDPSAALSFGMFGGLVGVLLGKLIDRLQRPKTLPEHLGDPDLDFLPETTKKTLSGTTLLVKFPVDRELIVRSTFAGYDFETPSQGIIVWKVGLLFKGRTKKMLTHLQLTPVA